MNCLSIRIVLPSWVLPCAGFADHAQELKLQ